MLAVRACASGVEGILTAQLRVAGSTGAVYEVRTEGVVLDARAAACVEEALLAVRLPRFAERSIWIRYPFVVPLTAAPSRGGPAAAADTERTPAHDVHRVGPPGEMDAHVGAGAALLVTGALALITGGGLVAASVDCSSSSGPFSFGPSCTWNELVTPGLVLGAAGALSVIVGAIWVSLALRERHHRRHAALSPRVELGVSGGALTLRGSF